MGTCSESLPAISYSLLTAGTTRLAGLEFSRRTNRKANEGNEPRVDFKCIHLASASVQGIEGIENRDWKPWFFARRRDERNVSKERYLTLVNKTTATRYHRNRFLYRSSFFIFYLSSLLWRSWILQSSSATGGQVRGDYFLQSELYQSHRSRRTRVRAIELAINAHHHTTED